MSGVDSAAPAARIEAGRQLFARSWRFLWAAASVNGLPAPAGVAKRVEVAVELAALANAKRRSVVVQRAALRR